MTRRNDKRNNNTELPPFAQMLFGAIVGKGVDMIAKKMAEIADEKTPDIHAEGISNQDVTNINNGKATLSKLRIPSDGSAVEFPIPDNLQFFFAEDGKLMVRKKHAQNDYPLNEETHEKPITYYDICKELFSKKKTYWLGNKKINFFYPDEFNFKDINNSTSEAQVKRLAAFNKLQNIAKYINGDWKPVFDGDYENWNIGKEDDTFLAIYTKYVNKASVYFKSKDLALEAIRLMGEDSLNDLFSTDW